MAYRVDDDTLVAAIAFLVAVALAWCAWRITRPPRTGARIALGMTALMAALLSAFIGYFFLTFQIRLL